MSNIGDALTVGPLCWTSTLGNWSCIAPDGVTAYTQQVGAHDWPQGISWMTTIWVGGYEDEDKKLAKTFHVQIDYEGGLHAITTARIVGREVAKFCKARLAAVDLLPTNPCQEITLPAYDTPTHNPQDNS